ncbi:hypothetical protein [Acetobacter vaccinii]|uniref:DUF1311 domain-containing protein n=1 Tax=Acetobacter vaccinii TaxID=2592655 RepID=A0A5C1YT13_9PROT|nr:hypothetical protein [Acetobacter vaccinii]QEO17962.1 hypothetical protein FLP30_09610 [Acetobacter vaccinii]
MKKICVFIFLFFQLKSIANAAPSNRDLYIQCSDVFFASSDIVVCMTKKLSESEKHLIKEQKRVLALLKQWNVDQALKDNATKSIIESNNEFKKYNCNFSMSLMGGSVSNSHEITEKACLTSLNIQYIEQLEGDLTLIQKK